MARVLSFIKLSGSIENVTFITTKNGNFAKGKSTLNKEKIMNNPGSEPTRQTMNEFGRFSTAAALLKSALWDAIQDVKVGKTHNRINSIIAKVKRFDTTSPRGWRNVTTGIQQQGGKDALSGFDFNPYAPMDKLLKKKYSLNTEEGTLFINGIIPYTQFDYPKNAEMAMLQLFCTNIDWVTELSFTTSSEPTYINLDNIPQDINISLSSLPEGTGVNIFVLKLVYYDELNGKLNLFNNQEYRSAKIIAVE